MLKPIKEYIKIIEIVVSKYFNYYHDRNELISIGQIGLMQAYEKFNKNESNIKNPNFAAFAIVIIKRRIIEYLRVHGGFNFIKKRNGTTYHFCEIDENMIIIDENIDMKIDLENMLMNTKLNLNQRKIIIEHCLKGKSFNKISEELKMKEGTVFMNYRRGIEKIRKQFNLVT